MSSNNNKKKKQTKKKTTSSDNGSDQNGGVGGDDINTNNNTRDVTDLLATTTQQPAVVMSPEANAVLDMMRRQNLLGNNSSGTEINSSNFNGRIQQVIPLTRDGDSKKHAFWDTQPMPHGARGGHAEGPIVPNKPHEEIRSEPYTMPAGFEWSNVNLAVSSGDGDNDSNNNEDLQELYQLLANNYVEDDDALFRFDYSPEFLLWALQPPGAQPDFLFGVRSLATKKLVAFISAVPATVQVYEQAISVVEINFLCVHKKLRSKRLAPVLIKEITRRVNLTGTFQAVYTAGTVLPVPVSSARYYHRSLNPKKLANVGFSRVGQRMTLARMIKLYKLPETPEMAPALRPMEEKDVAGVHTLLTTYLQQFKLQILFTPEEIRHWLLPRDKVINSYVLSDGDGVVTDFCSFYHLPSSILNHNDTLYAAYSFYNVATTVPLTHLMKDALILAKGTGSDVFNALNLMENGSFLEELKFGMGDGNLQYYIYNWACPEMIPEKVGIVLL